jgi:NAD(P)-dependent dehydrogenase (short-subunit alcohol dehydrogenase family)
MKSRKSAIVTGASRGIGNAIAIRLAKEGYDIVTMGNSTQADAEAGLNSIRDAGAVVTYVKGSLGDKNARQKLIDEAVKIGRIDLLVNNASMAPRVRADILEMSAESLNEVLNVNLIGTFLLTQAVANCMVKQDNETFGCSPAIINISSVSADTVSTNRAEYCISKAGTSMATQLYAVRLAEYGIPVFEIRPGIILTDMIAPVKEKYEKRISEGLTPIKRLGLPEDVANAVWILASGQLTYATGQVLNVDGGLNIKRL